MGAVPGPVGPHEDDNLPPDELFQKDCPASTIFEKRALGDKIEYLVEWRDDAKENSWEDRATLWKNWLFRPLVNAYEETLLAKAKEMIKEWVMKNKGELSSTQMMTNFKDEMPYFRPNQIPSTMRDTHGNLRAICENIEGMAVLGLPTRFTVMTQDKMMEKQKFETEKQKKLKGFFCELIEILRVLGGNAYFHLFMTAFKRHMINQGYGKFDAPFLEPYGFMKLKEFVLACPGIYLDNTDEAAHTTGNVNVELRDPDPECLRDEMAEKVKLWKKLGIDRNRELPEKAQMERMKAQGPQLSMVERLKLLREGKLKPKPVDPNDPLERLRRNAERYTQDIRGDEAGGGYGRSRSRERYRRRSRSRSRGRRRKRSRSRGRKKKRKRSRSRRKRKRKRSSSSESRRKSPSSARSGSTSSS